ncbi:MAG: DUF5076 domain-containing protein [Phycisphaerales bacterium]
MPEVSKLQPPPAIHQAEMALEIARIWIVDNKQVVSLSSANWEDPRAWGLMLVDLAKHVANVYEKQGHNRHEVLAKIHQAFLAEWNHPTDEPTEM